MLGIPGLRLLRGLLTSNRPRHLRDLAEQYDLSPAGTWDVLRRLQEAGIVAETMIGNKRCFNVQADSEERIMLEQLFRLYEGELIRQRAPRFNKRAAARLKHMDEMYRFYRRQKKRRCN